MFKYLPLVIKAILMVVAVIIMLLSSFHIIKINKEQMDIAENIIQQQTGIKIDFPSSYENESSCANCETKISDCSRNVK